MMIRKKTNFIKSIGAAAQKRLKEFIARYKEDQKFQKKIWMIVGAAIISLIALSQFPEASVKAAEEKAASLDSAIPENAVLIPIKVQNDVSLEGVFDELGFVDLYSVPENEHKKSEQILSGVKMIRNPKQHDQFSIIVNVNEAPAVVRAKGVFFVTLQSREHHKTIVQRRKVVRVVTIEKN